MPSGLAQAPLPQSPSAFSWPGKVCCLQLAAPTPTSFPATAPFGWTGLGPGQRARSLATVALLLLR